MLRANSVVILYHSRRELLRRDRASFNSCRHALLLGFILLISLSLTTLLHLFLGHCSQSFFWRRLRARSRGTCRGRTNCARPCWRSTIHRLARRSNALAHTRVRRLMHRLPNRSRWSSIASSCHRLVHASTVLTLVSKARVRRRW